MTIKNCFDSYSEYSSFGLDIAFMTMSMASISWCSPIQLGPLSPEEKGESYFVFARNMVMFSMIWGFISFITYFRATKPIDCSSTKAYAVLFGTFGGILGGLLLFSAIDFCIRKFGLSTQNNDFETFSKVHRDLSGIIYGPGTAFISPLIGAFMHFLGVSIKFIICKISDMFSNSNHENQPQINNIDVIDIIDCNNPPIRTCQDAIINERTIHDQNNTLSQGV